jgi:hypothetical protein
MKFHTPSFLLGVGAAAAVMATRARLRPVAVELGALGVHLGRLGRALAERRWERGEDLWAEVMDRVRRRDEETRERRAGAGVEAGSLHLDGPAQGRA